MSFYFQKTTLDMLEILQQKVTALMTKMDDTQALVTAMTAAAAAISAKIDRLMAQMSGGLSAAEADQVIAELGTLKGQLETLGQ